MFQLKSFCIRTVAPKACISEYFTGVSNLARSWLAWIVELSLPLELDFFRTMLSLYAGGRFSNHEIPSIMLNNQSDVFIKTNQ